MSLAATIHSLRHSPTVLGAWDILSMATCDGAAALHLESEIGTLEQGKAADLAVVDLQNWSSLPGGDPAARIVYGGSAADVRHVVVAGRPVVVDKELTTVDSAVIRDRVEQAWQATRQRMEESP